MAKSLSLHPVSLGVRLVMELAAFAGFGYWGWHATPTGWRYVLVVVAPLVAMTVWGVFAVPDDPSRSGKAPVATPGPVRLVLELAIFFGGAAALYVAGATTVAMVFAVVVVVYHAVSIDRIAWLLKH